MDYVPPERPAIVAKTSERLLADSHQPKFRSAFGDIGLIDTLPDTGEWVDTTTWEQRMLLTTLKPGQRVVFAKPRTAPAPTFYVDQHKPCSPATFEAFEKIVASKHHVGLSGEKLQPLKELLGDRATGTGYEMRGGATDLGGRPGFVLDGFKSDHTFAQALFVIANRKKRLIQEIGYEGAASGENHWIKEAAEMLENIELKPEK